MNRTLTCKRCEDVIGVYEPMVVSDDGQVRETSRAAENGRRPPVGDCYHRDCYACLHAGDPGP